jgi:uncharacterized RDD family membrane protein YckC
MNKLNPYESPETVADADADAISRGTRPLASHDESPAVSTRNTLVPRLIAAILDNVIAMTLGMLAAKSLDEDMLAMQLLLCVAVYLGYYFLFERFISRTPGKALTGLVVIQFDGGRCTWRQSLIRTCFRLLEVNPVLLGAIPAAICILTSSHHQRLGDRIARTIVVPSRRVPKRHK